MPSKRSSKRASASARKSSVRKVDNTTMYKVNLDEPKRSINMFKFIFTLVIQGLIIYYLYNLESADCNCIKDWRHNYIKYFAIFLICWSLLHVLLPAFPKYKMIGFIIMILSLINVYAFFTYVGDLNSTKCVCAIDKQPNLNSIMDLYRWLQLIILCLGIMSFVFLFLFASSALKDVMHKQG